jgi:hypothetical protein
MRIDTVTSARAVLHQDTDHLRLASYYGVMQGGTHPSEFRTNLEHRSNLSDVGGAGGFFEPFNRDAIAFRVRHFSVYPLDIYFTLEAG